MIKRIMSKLFTDELLKLYSFSGKKGKIKFSQLAVCSVIFDAVKQNHKFKNVTQNDMEEVIKYVLAQAPFNIKRLEKKNDCGVDEISEIIELVGTGLLTIGEQCKGKSISTRIDIQQIEETVESQSNNISITVTDDSNDKIVDSFSA
ncbi:uncharacterized protein LOC103308045 [Acyrthosiphon pisum]|uniref:DUF4806 domain-containing protein n=1 Tax=Acyrthosiphon pisum TaxID=7029 RepID=A0A8R2NT90_ACYPI|nr:uncharacterized protein LOC103308045 [Acyrthosiphon pisum]